jgi:CoA:oxalate CoA-transferase
VLELVRTSHVVLENFRPGVAERLGIGWSAVHAANPAVVMVSISGFGQDSSLRARGAFAPTIHAAAGILHDHAYRLDAPLAAFIDARADLETGLHATIGALAALRVAERTGVGEHIDVAMYDALLATYSETPCELSEPPYVRSEAQPFDAGAHGWMSVAGPPQHVWRVAAGAFGLADPAPEGAGVPEKARLRHAALEHWMQKQPSRDALIAALEAADLPCAPVQTLREGLTGPFARERGLLVEVDDRRGARRRIVRLPQRYSRSQAGVPGPAPLRGEHNTAVLRELGRSDAEVAALEARGVIARGDDPHAR